MIPAFVRVISCWALWALGATALGGTWVGIVVSGIVALAMNYVWREQQRARLLERRRAEVIEDEELRIAVREHHQPPREEL